MYVFIIAFRRDESISRIDRDVSGQHFDRDGVCYFRGQENADSTYDHHGGGVLGRGGGPRVCQLAFPWPRVGRRRRNVLGNSIAVAVAVDSRFGRWRGGCDGWRCAGVRWISGHRVIGVHDDLKGPKNEERRTKNEERRTKNEDSVSTFSTRTRVPFARCPHSF